MPPRGSPGRYRICVSCLPGMIIIWCRPEGHNCRICDIFFGSHQIQTVQNGVRREWPEHHCNPWCGRHPTFLTLLPFLLFSQHADSYSRNVRLPSRGPPGGGQGKLTLSVITSAVKRNIERLERRYVD